MMKNPDFRDYDVRVWRGDVFINSHDVIGYADVAGGGGLQVNADDEDMKNEIKMACDKVRDAFLELDRLINKVEINFNDLKNEFNMTKNGIFNA